MPPPGDPTRVRLVHEPAGGDGEPTDDAVEVGAPHDEEEPASSEPRTLATTVETADTFLARARGLMLRRSVPEDFALVFRFDGAATRRVHTLFVAFPLDVLWVADDTVRRVERLHPWRGYGAARADTLVELPAGGATGVEPGDRVRVERA